MEDYIKGYQNNPDLKTPKSPLGWQGTPVDKKGRFVNLNRQYIPSLLDVFRWKLEKNSYRNEKTKEIWNPIVLRDDAWLKNDENLLVWLGHSTFYFRINGVSILTDPVFGDILSVKRKSEFPLNTDLLVNIDYILLSHDHRDHLDKDSLQILAKQNPGVRYLTGLGMKTIVCEFTGSNSIEEAGWYQQYNTENTSVAISFIPSQHWSARGLFDANLRLWGGFVIESDNTRILFGGDSGYGIQYKLLAEVFKRFDYAILGIGAYQPIWFMSANHQSPAEALKGFKELNAARFIPMHYGVFDLSDEPLGQPLKDLKVAASDLKIQGEIDMLIIGQPLFIDRS